MRLNKWKYLFKAYFNYTVKEQRAIIVLMIVISFLQIALIALHWVPVNGKSRNDLPSQVIDSAYRSNVDNSITSKGNSKTNSSSIKFFLFNPNTNTMNDWMKLGLTEKQSLSILKYVSKGGSFKVKSDLKKMHVVKPELLHQWWKYIQLPDSIVLSKNQSTMITSKPQSESKLNINSASVEELDKLPLIGEGRAKAIVTYREKLGGFIMLQQLLELKCIPDSVFQVIKDSIYTDGKIYQPLNINADSLFHPYLPKSFAKMIVSYRQQHKNYQRIDDLRILPLYDDKIMRKIAPYLTVKY
jgi:competence ComEA-like helix-hairpin-helix protein